MKKTTKVCNCCSADSWEYRFSEGKFHLGRCTVCGLHFIHPMPEKAQRMTEMAHGAFAENKQYLDGETLIDFAEIRQDRYEMFFQIIKDHAPVGKWLDIGCGTGTLINIATNHDIDIEGIELSNSRRSISRELTNVPIHDKPLEELRFPLDSFAAISLINVFSHLTDPKDTFMQIERVLKPGGILVLYTSEIAPGVRKEHNYDWALGDHLYFLGNETIEYYCNELGFTLAYRKKEWAPEIDYSEQNLRTKGRSRIRNLIKSGIVNTPGLLSMFRGFMLNWKQADNPVYSSVLVLRKGS